MILPGVCRIRSFLTSYCILRAVDSKDCASCETIVSLLQLTAQEANMPTAYHELEKNHNGQNAKVRDHDKVMYEQKGKARCPIKSLENISVNWTLNVSGFFSEAKIKNVSYWCCVVWQCACREKTLATKMRNLSKSMVAVKYTLIAVFALLPIQHFLERE